MNEFDDTNIARALVIMIILTLAATSVFYIINNTDTAVQAYPEGSFISEKTAFDIAESHFEKTIQDDWNMGSYWEDGKVGTPVLVRDVHGKPAYWKVPVEYKNRVIGYMDVNSEGTVARFGMYYRNRDMDSSPLTVLEMAPEDVMNAARTITVNYSDYAISEPVLVYHEYEGNEAWMLNVSNDEGVVSRIMVVTPAYVFETPLMKFNDENDLWEVIGKDELKLPGIDIAFEDGTTEPEVRSILENYDLVSDYELKYNITDIGNPFYVSVDEENLTVVKNKLLATQYYKRPWMQSADLFIQTEEKRSIIEIVDPIADDSDVLGILNTHNLQLKRLVWCYVDYGNETKNWVNEENATRIKNGLEGNGKIMRVFLDYPVG